jgi:hypothetical protein
VREAAVEFEKHVSGALELSSEYEQFKLAVKCGPEIFLAETFLRCFPPYQ